MTPNVDFDLDALLERGRVIPPVPDVVRARSLARARAAAENVKARPELMPAARRRGLTIALAASVAFAVLAATAVAAFRGRTPQAVEPPRPNPVVATRAPALQPPAPVAVPTVPSPAPAPHGVSVDRPRRPPTVQESYAAELELLHRAQTAHAGRDFVAALALLAEHGRRFPNGRLAEEREALHVRALMGFGRINEARRAAAAFAERFPRSVLLPRLASELQ